MNDIACPKGISLTRAASLPLREGGAGAPDASLKNVNGASSDESFEPLIPKTALQAFHLARMDATAYGTWQVCWFKRCRRVKKCLGGPRGTFKQFGRPLCVENGDQVNAARGDR